MSYCPDSDPFTSVILPIRNEANYIKRGLEAVLKQDYPENRMEIIISDGMSTDGTRKIIEDIRAKNGHIPIKIIENTGLIVPIGLNAAIQIAKGDIIVRVDGHCEIEKDYVRKCVEHLLKEKVDGVGGPIETIGETELSKTIAIAMSSVFGIGGSAFRTIRDRSMLVDTVAFPAYTRQIIEKVGPYDEELVRNQDDEYNYRIRNMGGKILLASDVRSKYYSRGSLRSLWKQYFQYGFWKVRVLQKHPGQMSLRQFIPPLFVFTLIFSVLLSSVSTLGKSLFFLIAGSYLVANIVASVLTAKTHGWLNVYRLPVVFSIIHISYGLGFLVGLIKFANRWNQSASILNH